MSLIQYQRASYAGLLRDQLERAGCESRVATVVSRAIGELIDHMASAEADLRRDMESRELQASIRRSTDRLQGTEVSAARRELFERFVGVALFIMAVALVCGVLIALFR
jgi:hypothetical protein